MKSDEKIVYSVVINGRQLRCINTSTGSTRSTIEFVGDIVTGPIVTDNKCVIVTKQKGVSKGRIYKLPSFSTITTFTV